jgi:hypothetical protein
MEVVAMINIYKDSILVEQYAQPPIGPQPLDPTGALATLLAVVGTLTVTDAANAIGLTPDDLVTEAEAWAAAGDAG